MKTARDISGTLLERSGTGLVRGDFPMFRSCFVLPVTIDTFDGRHVIETVDDLRARFDAVRCYHAQRNVTDLVRRTTEAKFRDPDTVAAVHTPRMLSGTQLVGGELSVLSVIPTRAGGWRVVSSQYAIENDAALNMALIGGRRTVTPGDGNLPWKASTSEPLPWLHQS